jgi:hypothetical protein
MRLALAIFLLGCANAWAAPPAPPTFDQIKADANPERRARSAIDFALSIQHDAEAAYAANDLNAVAEKLKTVQEAMELADSSLQASHKTPGRNPAPYKYAELKSKELLVRMSDLSRKMDAGERSMIDAPIGRIQEIHDAWFEGIMERKK